MSFKRAGRSTYCDRTCVLRKERVLVVTEYICALMTGAQINKMFDGAYYATFPPFAELGAEGASYTDCYYAFEAQLTAEVLRRMERSLPLPEVYGVPTPTLAPEEDIGDLFDVSS